MAFGENVDPTAAIRAILDNYPFSVGLFREFLQNSDDARATKQIFLLDYRSHATSSLYHPQLAEMQGPALLAYNDALFNQADWNALQSIHRSSKKTDTSKIGKYGIGFRSCYHVTDSPQILSGSSLAILDPRHKFSSEGGAKLELQQDFPFSDQLTPFYLSCIPSSQELPFSGSIIRLPLRTRPTSINDKPVVLQDIHKLLEDFIDNEIRICLLFLANITSIEVIEIDVRGNTSVLALSKIIRSESVHVDGPSGVFGSVDQVKHLTSMCSVETSINGECSTVEQWRIHHASFPQSDAASRLSQRAGCDPTTALSTHKLLPDVSIAAPLSILTRETYSGRLYTFLPLPLPTGFPVHIHSLFALTQSRQNLRNHEEKGIVRGSADSILVEWNRLLFDFYIPHAWMCMITTLITQDGLSDVFRAWPPTQGNQNGDAGYWKDLPAALLRCINDSRAPIWPVIATPNGPSGGCLALDSVVVSAWNNPGLSTLQALATYGMKITHPPIYIYKLLKSFNSLTPSSAHDILLKHVSELSLSSNLSDLDVIRKYLLTGDDLHNIVGLPLIPLPDNRYISLQSNGSSQVHMMFEKDDLEIFGRCENDPIVLHLLDKSLATILQTHGPSVLNVQLLTPQAVIGYLTKDSGPLSMIIQAKNVSYEVVDWLKRFWTWLGSWKLKSKLYFLIQELPLLPSNHQLQKTGSLIYTKLGVHPALVSGLEKLGIPFFHSDFSAPSQKVVSSFRPLSDINIISNLLDLLDVHHVRTVALDDEVARVLLKHFSRAHGPLSNEQRQILKKIPIFPLMQAGSGNTSPVWRSIPDDTKVTSVIMGSLRMLPVIKGTVFVDGKLVEPSFLNILDPDTCSSLTTQDILKLSIQHFATQSIQIQVAFLEYMAQHKDSISPAVFSQLRQTRFLVVLDGSLQAPENVVDPQSVIAPLFLPNDNRFPSVTDKTALIKCLQLLKIMQNTVTADIVRERIQFISLAAGTTPEKVTGLSRKLLRLLHSSSFDCADLKINQNLKWLPTQEGLLHPAGCHDEHSHQKELFDQVLPLVAPSIRISSSLRDALGWSQPLPIRVLANQLSKALNLRPDEAHKRIEILIKELSQPERELVDKDFKRLHAAIANRPWVPVSGGRLVNTSHAVFSDTKAGFQAGFHEIPFIQIHQRKFLLRMGCSEEPLASVVIQDLRAYSEQPPSKENAKSAIYLLKLLPPDLTEEQRRDILVPDLKNTFLPLEKVYYNDLGRRDCLIPANADIHILHTAVSEALASKLHIQFLGLKFAEVDGPRRDMGEDPITTIRNKLRDYTQQQFLTEFIANAADAGATEFSILIDHYQHSGGDTLSRATEEFQRCPSLVIHNNAMFTDKDFDKGICETGRGGKQERTDTIGQFGSGALTMFHFSEVVTIVSGKRVMLLDPSREHLPREDRVLSLSLDYVNSFYPDELASLNGIFEFHQSCSDYNGTIFRLPLRNESHRAGKKLKNFISDVTWTAKMIEKEIILPFVPSAHEFLLFTQLKAIKFLRRDKECITSCWQPTISAVHEDRDMDGRYCSKIVNIYCHETAASYQRWSVVSTHVPREDFPSYALEFSDKYRLRSPIIAGLATRLDSPARDQALSHKFFSMLPLPVPNSLPVHINAPFILSSDRRQIRFDAYDPLVSKYNQWLLETVIPPLYLFLLADLLTQHGQNMWLWPGDAEDGSTHDISQSLVSAFYQTHLCKTELQVFLSQYTPCPLSPSEAIFLKPGSPPVLKKVLGFLRPRQVTDLPSRILSRSIQAGIAFVTPLFMKSELLRYTGDLTSQLDLAELRRLLDFICKDDMKHLIDLPLLPLADGTFGTFENPLFCTKMYFISQPGSSNYLFSQSHFVHPGFKLSAAFSDVNITQLSISGIKQLIQEIVPLGSEHNEMLQSEHWQEWIERFWSEYPLLQFDAADLLDCISSFPLVPTMQQGSYLSISECKNQSSVIIASSESLQVRDNRRFPPFSFTRIPIPFSSLAKLGMTVVNPYSSNFPEALQNILKPLSGCQLDHILLTLGSSAGLSITQRFQRLEHYEYPLFANWLRVQMSDTPKDSELLHVARLLPIWPPVRSNLSLSPHFLSAAEVVMLPCGVTSIAVKPFINDIVFTEYSKHLKHLGVVPMSLVNLFGALHFSNNILPLSEMENYLKLLRTITTLADGETPWVLVPNCNRVMCRSNTLYARDPLFLAAFGSISQHFVANEARELEPKLKSDFGLQGQHPLNMAKFRICAGSIDDDLSVDKSQRAEVIFRIYCQDLSLVSDTASLCSMNHLKFIPRANGRTRWGRDVLAYVRNQDLPDVVAPKNIVLRKHEAIAWTQRVLCLADPNPRILIANPSFGLPTTDEVVRHLYILALKVSSDYPQDRGVLQDLRATYAWLDEHSEDAGMHMIQHHSHKLFLNVADPETMTWEWHSADDLLLGIKEMLHTFHPIHEFLHTFEDLLVVSGVKQLRDASLPPKAISSTLEVTPHLMRLEFSLMRSEHQLTDVLFIPDVGDDELNDINLYAHRVYLATCSDYFKTLFTGDFRESRPASEEFPVQVPLVGHSSRCVGIVLDFLYNGIFDEDSPPDLEDLLEIIKLSHYWGIPSLHQKTQYCIIPLITPLTVTGIDRQARVVEAHIVAEQCSKYRKDNWDIIGVVCADELEDS